VLYYQSQKSGLTKGIETYIGWQGTARPALEPGMHGVFEFMKMIAILVAAIVVGNWFLSELKKAKVAGAPWYHPYLTIPGILIIIAVFSPLILRMLGVL
jgi:hypothetical protein